MKPNYVDLTSLLIGARNNESAALQQLARKFANGRFLVPLATTKGVRNAPESVKEMGTDLPAHFLSLADGTRGAVFLTNRSGARLAEKELSWKTDHRRLRCISVPGTIVADHAEVLFDAGVIDRVILNPGGPNETHLSQGDLAALAKGQPPSTLSFHAGEIPLPSFMTPTLVGSLADVAFSKADSFFKKVTKHLEVLGSQSASSSQTISSSTSVEPIVIGGGNQKLDALVSQLFAVFSKLPPDESAAGLFVSVNKVGGDVQITANRPVPHDLLSEAHQAVKQTLTGPGSFQLNLDLSMSQLLSGNGLGTPGWILPVSKESAPNKPAPKKTSAPERENPEAASRSQRHQAKRGRRRLDYIPLEPESSDKSGK